MRFNSVLGTLDYLQPYLFHPCAHCECLSRPSSQYSHIHNRKTSLDKYQEKAAIVFTKVLLLEYSDLDLNITLCPVEGSIVPVLIGLKVLIEVATYLDKDYFIISFLKVFKVVRICP